MYMKVPPEILSSFYRQGTSGVSILIQKEKLYGDFDINKNFNQSLCWG